MHAKTGSHCLLVLGTPPYLAVVITWNTAVNYSWRSVNPLSSNISQTDGKAKSRLIIVSKMVPKELWAS